MAKTVIQRRGWLELMVTSLLAACDPLGLLVSCRLLGIVAFEPAQLESCRLMSKTEILCHEFWELMAMSFLTTCDQLGL